MHAYMFCGLDSQSCDRQYNIGKMAAANPFVIGAVIIGGTAIGTAVSVKKKMKHTSVITNLMNLTVGDHISLRVKGALPFSHAIVTGAVENPEDKVEVVYMCHALSGARVEFMEADLCEQALNQELERHRYDGLISYPAQVVAERAKSLCSHYISWDENEVIRVYWQFFRDDEHFANWCQIGFSLKDGMKAAIKAGYSKTMVSDVASLREGIVTSRKY